jgi:hypothetical protein
MAEIPDKVREAFSKHCPGGVSGELDTRCYACNSWPRAAVEPRCCGSAGLALTPDVLGLAGTWARP